MNLASEIVNVLIGVVNACNEWCDGVLLLDIYTKQDFKWY